MMEKNRCIHGLSPCVQKMLRFMTLTVLMMFIFNVGVMASGNTVTGVQQNSISGKVIDESGETLPGVTVLLNGPTKGYLLFRE
jgi:hypothetical protein